MEKFNLDEGKWRTIGGRRVFIREGQSLSDAMKASGKFKSAKKKNEVKDESKSFTREELKEKYGTDNTDIINAGKAKEDRVTLKEDKKELNLSQRQKDEGNRLNTKAENGAREDVKTFLSGKEDYDGSREDFIRDLSNEWGISKEKAEEILHDENIKHPRNFTNNQQKNIEKNMPEGAKFSKMLEENNVKTFADEIKENDVANRVKENKIVDSYGKNVVYQTKEGNYITSRQNYNDYVNGKTNKLGGELVLNEKEARERLASYDADEKYPYKGYVDDVKTGNGQKAEELKKETLNKMYKSIGYDDSKYNYGLEKEKTSSEKYSVDYFKQRGVEIKDSVPEGYVKLEGATTAPKGYEWYSNGKSRFGGEYKNALIKKGESKRIAESDIKEKGYEYYSRHGLGPGTLPKDVNTGGTGEMENGWTKFKTDRPLTNEELKKYDIQPETRNSEIKENNNQITNALRRKAYQKYLKEHPASKISFEDFKDMRK